MSSIAEEIEALRRLSVPELVGRYREVWGREPRCRNREHLWKRIAWRLQEQKHGGLSAVAKARLEELIADLDLPLPERARTVAGALTKPRRPSDPAAGTTLVRTWKGRDVRVNVVEGGFEHEGVVYKSLSAVTKAITGAHWNGRLFFGLSSRRKSE